MRTFEFRGSTYLQLEHEYNCGFIPARLTERTVELPVLNMWLTNHLDVWEVGAVSPYYPLYFYVDRPKRIIDLYDPSPFVTDRVSLQTIDFTGQNVVSISTVEHVQDGGGPISAIHKLLEESKSLLLTTPLGYEEDTDRYLLRMARKDKAQLFQINRRSSEFWEEVPFGREITPYTQWANSVAFLIKE